MIHKNQKEENVSIVQKKIIKLQKEKQKDVVKDMKIIKWARKIKKCKFSFFWNEFKPYDYPSKAIRYSNGLT